jgi:hypothetical protein
MAFLDKLVSHDENSGGALGVAYFMLPYGALLLLPPYILQYSWRWGLSDLGVALTVISSVLLSLTSSAIWNAYLRPASRSGYGWLGIAVVVVVLVALDEIRDLVRRFPSASHDEQIMHSALVIWTALIAFASKTPWDDLRDKITARIRRRIEPAALKS